MSWFVYLTERWRHTIAYALLFLAAAGGLYVLQRNASEHNHQDALAAQRLAAEVDAQNRYVCARVENIRRNQLQVFAALIEIRAAISNDKSLDRGIRLHAKQSLKKLKEGRARVLALNCHPLSSK